MTAPLPKGYKRTEVGVIPEEWEVKRMGEISKQVIGLTYDPKDINHEGVLVLRASNIGENELVFEDNVFVNTSVPDHLMIRKGDLLVCVRNGSHNLIGKSALIKQELPQTTFGAFMTVVRSEYNEFLSHIFQSRIIKEQIIRQLGATINQITNKSLRSFLVPFPPLPEQRAIAAALGDVDALLAALDRLIAKKRAVQAAAMRDLLTGRVRLPGFDGSGRFKQTEAGLVPEEWEVKQIGKAFEFLSTSSRSRIDLSEDGDVFYIHYGDIHTKWDFILDFDKAIVPKIDLQKIKGVDFLEDGDLVLVDASEDDIGAGKAVEIQNIRGRIAVAGLHTIALRSFTGEFVDGFKAYIQAMAGVKKQIKRLVTGLKVFGISKNNLAGVFVPVPHLPEQTAIAAVLSDLDAELAALERERAKWQSIKQGMMDDLLTGRVRLV